MDRLADALRVEYHHVMYDTGRADVVPWTALREIERDRWRQYAQRARKLVKEA